MTRPLILVVFTVVTIWCAAFFALYAIFARDRKRERSMAMHPSSSQDMPDLSIYFLLPSQDPELEAAAEAVALEHGTIEAAVDYWANDGPEPVG